MSFLAGIHDLADLDLENQRVFVRSDLEAPTDKSGAVTDTSRIRSAVPTLRKLLDSGARVIVGSRFGETRMGLGELRKDDAPSIEPAAAALAEHLGAEVLLPDACTGDSVKKVVSSLREGQICLLENLAGDDDTGAGDEAFARLLLEYVDMYVGDAPRALGLESATTTILPRLLERRVAGLDLRAELDAVARLKSERSRLFVWGGNSFTDRLPLLERLLGPGDQVLLVGVPANTLTRARGGAMGRSTVEEGYLAGARTFFDKWRDRVVLPRDFLVATSPKAPSGRVAAAGELSADEMALDLGPASVAELEGLVEKANAVLWCGTAGFHRNEAFATGTRAIVSALGRSSAFTLVAGDDSVAAAHAVGSDELDRIDRVSTGGRATLSLLSDNKLVGLEALRGISHDPTHPPDRR